MNAILRSAVGLAAILAAVPAPSWGQDKSIEVTSLEERGVLSGKIRLDPATGYIFLHSSVRTVGTFFRVPDDATRATYEKDRLKAFKSAMDWYPRRLSDWKTKALIAEKKGDPPPEMPQKPDLESFAITSIELRDSVSIGPDFVFRKGEGRFDYLTSVKPGTYIYYGPVMSRANVVPTGMCYCMGTVRFDVKPGAVTDLGDFLGMASFGVSNVAFGLPDTLKGWPVVKAEFHASGKLNNYYGLLVSRLPPIEGVLAYKRDIVIDARSGSVVPNPPIITLTRIKK